MTQQLTKSELFANAYIRRKGNGTQAALEVFDIRSSNPENTAHAIACEYLRKPTVKRILRGFLRKEMSLTGFVAHALIEIIEDHTCSHETRLKAIAMVSRIFGFEVEESLYTIGKAQIAAKARITMRQMELDARGH